VRLEIRRKGLRLAASTRQYLADHLSSALGNFVQRIRLVTIHLADNNGPRVASTSNVSSPYTLSAAR